MDGCVSVGRVKIDDSVSYGAAACWAGVIDNEIHVNFLSLWANGGHSKGSAKIVMLRGRTDTLRWHLNRTEQSKLCPAICRHLRVRYSQVIHRLPPASSPVELRSLSKSKWATHLVSGRSGWVPREFWGGPSGLHRAVARRTIKVDAVHGFDNPKAFGKAIHLYIERAIHLRKLGGAGLFALGAAKIFNPTVAGRHLPSMRLRCFGSTSIPLPHSN